MFKSGSWRTFKDGLGTYEFLSGEFDYFLTQQGVHQEGYRKLTRVGLRGSQSPAVTKVRILTLRA
jgi:hypothetical protein